MYTLFHHAQCEAQPSRGSRNIPSGNFSKCLTLETMCINGSILHALHSKGFGGLWTAWYTLTIRRWFVEAVILNGHGLLLKECALQNVFF